MGVWKIIPKQKIIYRTTQPDKHDRFFSGTLQGCRGCKKWLAYCMLQYTRILDKSLFTRYQKQTAMYNWLPCRCKPTFFGTKDIWGPSGPSWRGRRPPSTPPTSHGQRTSTVAQASRSGLPNYWYLAIELKYGKAADMYMCVCLDGTL